MCASIGQSPLMRRLYAFVLVIISLTRPVAAADSDTTVRAKKIEQEARDAYAQGQFDRAADLFDQANRLAPYPELRYNAALSWDQAGEKARAADAYEGALRLGGLDQARI